MKLRKRHFNLFGFVSRLTRLSKLRVFNQILVLIIIMILFLVIQGISSIKRINTMQTATEVVYNQSSNQLTEINNLKMDIQKVPLKYLECMVKGTLLQLNLANDIQSIMGKIKYVAGIDDSSEEMLLKKFGEIEELLYLTPNINNYQTLQGILFSINNYLENAYSTVFNDGLRTIEGTNQYLFSAKNNTYLLLTLTGIISFFIGLTIASSISGPLNKIRDATERLAVGDLSQEVTVFGCFEVTEMVKGLNQAIHGLRELVIKVDRESNALFTAGEELKNSSAETGRSATDVAGVMQHLASATSQQATETGKAVEIILLLSKLVKKVAVDVEDMLNASERVSESARQGETATDDLADEVLDIFTHNQEAATVILNLKQMSDEISAITSVIEEIAEQTTLLSLNAAIEAARAGTQGKGFGVIAHETGKLAARSKKGAKLIGEHITQMKVLAEQAVNVMEEGVSRAEHGRDLATKATVIFKEIINNINGTLQLIYNVSLSAKEMSSKNDTVISSINNISTLIKNSAARTEQVSGIAQEQSAAVEEISMLADNLSIVSDTLKNSVSSFRF